MTITTTTTTTTSAEATVATLSTHSALETLLMTTTPQLMKDDKNTASSEKKKLSEGINDIDVKKLEKHTIKNGNEFTVSYANSRLVSQTVGVMCAIPCSNLDVQTPIKALFTNQNNEQEQQEEELHQYKKENEQQKECLEENDEEDVHCTITNEEACTHVNCMEEAKESNNINNDHKKKKYNCKSSGCYTRTGEHASTLTQKLMEEPSTLLFLTPTYRNKLYAALQEINNNNVEANAINCDNVITSCEDEKKAVNINDNQLEGVNNKSSNAYNENMKIENRHDNHNDEVVNIDGGSNEKSENTTQNIYNLSETDAYTRERQIFTDKEVYDLLKSTLTKYELQRDEEEANVLSHLRTEMDALQEKYEMLCVERQKTEKEKQELECELKRVITTLEELMKNKMSDDADMQERLQQTQHLLAEKEKVISELKDKIHQKQTKTSEALLTSTHNTSDANTWLLPKKTITKTLLSTSEETETKTRAITTNCESERLVNANVEKEEISLAQCANHTLEYCTTENCDDDNIDDVVAEMTTVDEIMSKMNEMHRGMTAMESTLKEQQARIRELERDLQNKESSCKELEKANTELQQRDGKFTQSNNKSDKEWTTEIENLQSTINAQRKEIQTQIRKIIALQNERTSHVNFSRDLESFTQMLLQEQSEIYTKLAKLNNNGVNKTTSKLRKMTALLHKICNVTMCHAEFTDKVIDANCNCDDGLQTNAAATIITSSSITDDSANNIGSVNKVVSLCETKEEGEVDSFDDVNMNTNPSSSTNTNIYDFASKPCKQQNISGKMSKAIRLLEIRRRAIARVVQQIERQLLSIMVIYDKAYHHCCCNKTAQSLSPHSNIKENDMTLSETNSKSVSEKQAEISNLREKSKYTLHNNSSINNYKVHAIPESSTNATSPSPHRPSINNKVILHSSSSSSSSSESLARRNKYNIANAIQLCSSSEEYSSSRHGLSASQETEHTETNSNTNGDKCTAINNVRSNSANWHLPRTNTKECLQVGAVLDGGSLCPLPPPRLRVCD